MNLQLILLGAPGSGKGTQAKRLKTELGFGHLSTGDLLRKEIEDKSPIGIKVQEIMNSGQLVDDSTVVALLKNNCELSKNSYIFDGFPRNLNQAVILDNEILDAFPYRVIYLEMQFEDLVKRIVYRRICGSCGQIYNLIFSPPKDEKVCDKCGSNNLLHREDDKEEVLKKRYDVFISSISPIINYYRKKNIFTKIDASRDPELIFQKIKDTLPSK